MSAVARVGARGGLPGDPGDAGGRSAVPSHAVHAVDATVDALAELSAADRAAVVLIYFHGHTQAEVAARLGMPPAEVRRRVACALVGLGNRLRGSDASRRVEQVRSSAITRPRSP